MSPNVKFTYFNSMALGEGIRLLLKYGDVDFTDNRFSEAEWLGIKPTTPFGVVPVYEENGKVSHQSVAIARYVGKKVKLAGSNDWENLEIDAIVDTINDLKGKMQQYFYEEIPTTRKSLQSVLFDETLPFYLGKFEEIAQQNNGHFALGKLTWADFFFVGMLTYLNYMADKNLVGDYPNLTKVVENVTSIPNVKTWIEKRPKTQY